MADAELGVILKAIEIGIRQTLNECKKPIAVYIAASTQGKVYDAYRSGADVPYQRRETNGGLKDPDNYEVTVDGMELTVVNNTKGNPMYQNSQGWDEGYITDLIESGDGYHWTQSEIYREMPWERPFMEQSGDEFIDEVFSTMLDMKMAEILGG